MVYALGDVLTGASLNESHDISLQFTQQPVPAFSSGLLRLFVLQLAVSQLFDVGLLRPSLTGSATFKSRAEAELASATDPLIRTFLVSDLPGQ